MNICPVALTAPIISSNHSLHITFNANVGTFLRTPIFTLDHSTFSYGCFKYVIQPPQLTQTQLEMSW